jgi:hypothetical protein
MSQSRIIRRLRDKAKKNGKKNPIFTFNVANNYAVNPTKISFMGSNEEFNDKNWHKSDIEDAL